MWTIVDFEVLTRRYYLLVSKGREEDWPEIWESLKVDVWPQIENDPQRLDKEMKAVLAHIASDSSTYDA